jgi:hypothetical protein
MKHVVRQPEHSQVSIGAGQLVCHLTDVCKSSFWPHCSAQDQSQEGGVYGGRGGCLTMPQLVSHF